MLVYYRWRYSPIFYTLYTILLLSFVGCAKHNNCPYGQVYKNSTSDICVPKNKCKIPCKIEGIERSFYDGDVVVEDSCHSW